MANTDLIKIDLYENTLSNIDTTTIDENAQYNIKDMPIGGITNAEMVLALQHTKQGIFRVGSVYVCTDTVANQYTEKHLYKFLGNSWEDVTFIQDLPIEYIHKISWSNSTTPMSFNNMIDGHLYIFDGYLRRDSTSTTYWYFSTPTLMLKDSSTRVTVFNARFAISSSSVNYRQGYVTYITHNNSYATGANTNVSFTSLNGTSGSTTSGIYAPTAAGTSGYLLQSNGTGLAPTWTNLPFKTASGTVNLATSLTTGNLYRCSGNLVVLSASTLAITNYLMIFKISSTQAILYNCTLNIFGTIAFLTQNVPQFTIVTFNSSTGYITNYDYGKVISNLNGSTSTGSFTIYAPTTAGTAGQILQSNGSGAPIWASIQTGVSSSSTDTQIPSAKCLYDNINTITEIAEGKTANYVISYATTGTNIVNSSFNSVADTITIDLKDSSDNDNKIQDVSTNDINISSLQIGDIVCVTETDIPDRWVGAISSTAVTLYKMETKFTIDSTPTQSSTNPVSSGGVYTYVNNAIQTSITAVLNTPV